MNTVVREKLIALEDECRKAKKDFDDAITKIDAADPTKAEGGALLETATKAKEAFYAAKTKYDKFFAVYDLQREADAMKLALDSTGAGGDGSRLVPFGGPTKEGERLPVDQDGVLGFKGRTGEIEITPEGIFGDDNGAVSAKAFKLICQPDYKRAFANFIRKRGDLSRMRLAEAKMIEAVKTFQEGLDDDAGVLAPAELLMRLITRKPTPTRVAGRCNNLTCSRDALILPKKQYSADNLYTTAFRVTWTGEIPASSTAARIDDTAYVGTFRVPIHTAMMTTVITKNMLEDAALDFMALIEGDLGQTVDLLRDNMVLNGVGVNQPEGMLYAVDVDGNRISSIASGSASALTADGLVSLIYSLPEQYHDQAVVVMNYVNTAQAVAKLKDLNNRYLFAYGITQDGLASARPKELLGWPLILSGFMPNVGTNAFPILYGDLRGYYLASRVGFSIQVLNEVYAESGQVGLVGRLRFGGQVGEPWRMYAQKCHT